MTYCKNFRNNIFHNKIVLEISRALSEVVKEQFSFYFQPVFSVTEVTFKKTWKKIQNFYVNIFVINKLLKLYWK